MIDICFLGGLYPREMEKEFFNNSKWGLMYAANNHQWRIIEGFESINYPISIVSAPYLSTFLRGYKKLQVPQCYFGKEKKYNSVGFHNIYFFGNKFSQLVSGLEAWYSTKNNLPKCIIIYSLDSTSIKAALEIKHKHNDVCLCQLIPDMPEDMAANLIYRVLRLKEKDEKFIYQSMSQMDMFIYLSKNMNEKVNKQNKPYMISEGLYRVDKENIPCVQRKKKTILYTGNLNNKYGIQTLIDSFSYLDEAYTLLVRGDGEMVPKVKAFSLSDRRIKYLERMNYEDLQKLQAEVNLLVNPVSPQQSFTNNFFPSKTMEYLASGTPVLMYRLGGVPDEYYEHIYMPDDLSAKALARKIQEICEMPEDIISLHCQKARQFILNEKNAKVMVEKMIDFVERNVKKF